MQAIRNIIIILLFLFLISSCSMFNKGRQSTEIYRATGGSKELISDAVNNNVGKEDFTISRFRIDYREGNNSKKAGGYIKHRADGIVLVSIRSVAGIEIARARIDLDSIKVYDRVNNVMYIQKVDYTANKFGFQADLIDLMWGDLPQAISRDLINDNLEINTYSTQYNNEDLKFLIDSSARKLRRAGISNTKYSTMVVEYSDFKVYDGFTVPCEVSAKNLTGELVIKLKYYNWKFEKIRNMRFETGKVDDYIILK